MWNLHQLIGGVGIARSVERRLKGACMVNQYRIVKLEGFPKWRIEKWKPAKWWRKGRWEFVKRNDLYYEKEPLEFNSREKAQAWKEEMERFEVEQTLRSQKSCWRAES